MSGHAVFPHVLTIRLEDGEGNLVMGTEIEITDPNKAHYAFKEAESAASYYEDEDEDEPLD